MCFVVLAALGCNTSGFESSCKGLTHSGVVLGYLQGLGFRGLGFRGLGYVQMTNTNTHTPTGI